MLKSQPNEEKSTTSGTLPEKADWVAFVLHFVAGLAAGCIFGLVTIVKRRHGIWLESDLVFPYLSGTALFAAGLAALLGDRLWVGDNYRVIPPSENKHSSASRLVAKFTALAGVFLALGSLLLHFL